MAVGRIPWQDPQTVKRILANSMEFERRTAVYKHRVLSAMSMFDIHGQCWTPGQGGQGGAYVPCNPGTDGSFVGQIMAGFQTTSGYTVDRLYENEPLQVGGIPTGASGINSPDEVTQMNVSNYLNQGALDESKSYGLVNILGHGNYYGVYRVSWLGDLFPNGRIDQPSEPTQTHPNGVNEVEGPMLISYFDPPQNTFGAPIFILGACETGNWSIPNNFGAFTLANSSASAWIGGVGVLPYQGGWQKEGQGALQDITVGVNRRLLVDQMRLGDAVWDTMAEYMLRVKSKTAGGWWAFNYSLFGDPTLSYMGNPTGDAGLAAWPMQRYNSRGLSMTSLQGPAFPKLIWQTNAPAHYPESVQPSPVVGPANQVIVAYQTLDILQQGVIQKSHPLNAQAVGAPAISAAGTIYVADRQGWLYAFDGLDASSKERWRIYLGGLPLGGPVVGSDGMIAIAVDYTSDTSRVYLIRPDKVILRIVIINGKVVGGLAVGANRIIYGTTSKGQVFALGAFAPSCKTPPCLNYTLAGPAYSTPPLLYAGGLYAGRSDGKVLRFDPTSLALQNSFDTVGAVSSGPTAGPGGQVLVGDNAGYLYSLSPALNQRWVRNQGAIVRSLPAASAEAIYLANGDYLEAYHPHTGELLTSAPLGAGANGGSAALGYGREIYVQTGQGRLVALGEGWMPKSFSIVSKIVKSPNPGSTPYMKVSWTLANSGGLNKTSSPEIGSGWLLLQRSREDSAWRDLALLPPSALEYDDYNLELGVSYRYRLQRLDPLGNDSDFTLTMGSVHSLPTPPAAPILNTVVAESANSLRLNWTPAAGIEQTFFRIEGAMQASDPFTEIGRVTGGVTEFRVENLLPNTTINLRLVAINDASESAPSNGMSGSTRSQNLAAPQNVSAVMLADGSVRIAWEGGPSGALAIIEANPEGRAGFEAVGSVPATDGVFSYYPIRPGNYLYRVKFVLNLDESPYATTTLRLATAGYHPGAFQVVYLPLTVRCLFH